MFQLHRSEIASSPVETLAPDLGDAGSVLGSRRERSVLAPVVRIATAMLRL
jgi:hypothetical protein